MTQITLKDQEATFLALKSNAEDVAAKCNKIQVTDDISLGIAMQQLGAAKTLIKQIDDIRKREKEPYFNAGKQIDALAKTLSTPIETALSAGEEKIKAYNRLLREKAEKEAQRVQAIKNEMQIYCKQAMKAMDESKTVDDLRAVREKWIVNAPTETYKEFEAEFYAIRQTLNDYAKSRKTAIEAPKEADPEEKVVIQEAVIEKIEAVPQVQEHVDVKGIKVDWDYEVVDLTKVPHALLMINDKAVKQFIKENKENMTEGEVKGLRFFPVDKIRIR